MLWETESYCLAMVFFNDNLFKITYVSIGVSAKTFSIQNLGEVIHSSCTDQNRTSCMQGFSASFLRHCFIVSNLPQMESLLMPFSLKEIYNGSRNVVNISHKHGKLV